MQGRNRSVLQCLGLLMALLLIAAGTFALLHQDGSPLALPALFSVALGLVVVGPFLGLVLDSPSRRLP